MLSCKSEAQGRLRRDPEASFLDLDSPMIRFLVMCRLVQEGKAYPCFCTDEEITQMKAQAEAESRPPIYTGKWAHASAEEVEQEKAKVRAAAPAKVWCMMRSASWQYWALYCWRLLGLILRCRKTQQEKRHCMGDTDALERFGADLPHVLPHSASSCCML